MATAFRDLRGVQEVSQEHDRNVQLMLILKLVTGSRAVAALVGVLVTLLIGCSRVSKDTLDNESHFKRAGMVYTKFMQKNRGRGPANEKELADFLNSLPQADLDAMGITDKANVLISPRDGQPYGIVPKVDMSMMMGGGPRREKQAFTKPPIAMYEKTGSGGKRYVFYVTGGGVSLMDDQAFREAVPDAK